MRLLRTAITCQFAFLITGCIPLPHVHYRMPAVSGLVVAGGVPVAGATVRVRGVLPTDTQLAVTGTDGRFSTPALRGIRLVFVLTAEAPCGVSVELAVGAKTYRGFSECHVGDAPTEIEFSCDLERPISRRGEELFCSSRVHR